MVEALPAAPAVVKVLTALALILLVNHFTKQLLLSVAAGAAVLALWSGHSPAAIGSIAWEQLSSRENLLLVLIVFEVIWLSSQMSETGVMDDLTEAVRATTSKRGAIAALPAMIGLLPMPGGALFSAPLVESCDEEAAISNPRKAQANHWFRHVWEYWWPLYPGVLLAVQISGLEIWQIMLLGLPLTAGSIGFGYLFLLRDIREPENAARAPGGRRLRRLLLLLAPIIVVVVVYAAASLVYARLAGGGAGNSGASGYASMAAGLLCAILYLQVSRPLDRRRWRRVLLSPRALNMVLIISAVLIYGAFIKAQLPGGGTLVGRMRDEIYALGVPLMVVVMLIPLISGLAMGISVGFVGASFPIVFKLLGADPSFGEVASTAVLAYGFGYMGMLLSPVHVCLVVTSEYFNTRVLPNTVGMLRPAAMMLAWALVLSLVVRAALA